MSLRFAVSTSQCTTLKYVAWLPIPKLDALESRVGGVVVRIPAFQAEGRGLDSHIRQS